MFTKQNFFKLCCIALFISACTPDLFTEEYPVDPEVMSQQESDNESDSYETGDDQSLDPDNEKDG